MSEKPISCRIICFIYTLFLFAFWIFAQTHLGHAAMARIKDIVDIQGVRGNDLVGYGLVVGQQIRYTVL